jgi:hypothetical protein
MCGISHKLAVNFGDILKLINTASYLHPQLSVATITGGAVVTRVNKKMTVSKRSASGNPASSIA